MSDNKWITAVDILKDLPKNLQDAIASAPLKPLSPEEVARKQHQYIEAKRFSKQERIEECQKAILDRYREIAELQIEIQAIMNERDD